MSLGERPNVISLDAVEKFGREEVFVGTATVFWSHRDCLAASCEGLEKLGNGACDQAQPALTISV